MNSNHYPLLERLFNGGEINHRLAELEQELQVRTDIMNLTSIVSESDKKGDIISINIPELKLEIKVSDEEMQARREKWQPREPKVTTGYLARYASMVTSGNRGAILEVPKAK